MQHQCLLELAKDLGLHDRGHHISAGDVILAGRQNALQSHILVLLRCCSRAMSSMGTGPKVIQATSKQKWQSLLELIKDLRIHG